MILDLMKIPEITFFSQVAPKFCRLLGVSMR